MLIGAKKRQKKWTWKSKIGIKRRKKLHECLRWKR